MDSKYSDRRGSASYSWSTEFDFRSWNCSSTVGLEYCRVNAQQYRTTASLNALPPASFYFTLPCCAIGLSQLQILLNIIKIKQFEIWLYVWQVTTMVSKSSEIGNFETGNLCARSSTSLPSELCEVRNSAGELMYIKCIRMFILLHTGSGCTRNSGLRRRLNFANLAKGSHKHATRQ
jgi:hypothetical protein